MPWDLDTKLQLSHCSTPALLRGSRPGEDGGAGGARKALTSRPTPRMVRPIAGTAGVLCAGERPQVPNAKGAQPGNLQGQPGRVPLPSVMVWSHYLDIGVGVF